MNNELFDEKTGENLYSRFYFTRGAEIERISRWLGAELGQAPHEIADLLQQQIKPF